MHHKHLLTIFCSLSLIFMIGCDDEAERLKRENEMLKAQMQQELKTQKKEVQELKNEFIENNRLKKITFLIKVNMFKPDSRKWDLTGGPDVFGEIRINNEVLNIEGDEDDFDIQGILRNAKIEPGDKVRIILFDRDFSEHDRICGDEFIYEGENIVTKRLENIQLRMQVI